MQCNAMQCNAKVTTMFTRMMTMSLWQTKLAKAKFYADQDDDHDDDMDFKKDDNQHDGDNQMA